MPAPGLQAVLLPVFAKYLQVLSQRADDPTTMIWGWQGKARRMVAPVRLLKKQKYVPFLFRSMESAGQVTHVAITGVILYKDTPNYNSSADWLRDHRIEKFAGTRGGDQATTFYVVAAGYTLPTPLPFETLTLASEGRALAPGMVRGYARVVLPDSLLPWYQRATAIWDGLDLPPALRAA